MNRLRVLTYHRILAPEEIPPYFPQLVSAYPDEFERQMTWLAKHYAVVDIPMVLEAIERKTRLPRGAVLVTFDDGYPDFQTTAWPILKAHKLPATLFIPTNYPAQPSTPFWWDELHAKMRATTQPRLSLSPSIDLPLETERSRRHATAVICARAKTMPHRDAMQWVEEIGRRLEAPAGNLRSTMDWDQLRGLAADGVTLAAHSRSHALLTALPEDQLHDEIAGSKADLEREIGACLPVFCYPAGACNRNVEAAAQRAGMRLAFTTETGHNDLDADRLLALRRLNVTPRTTLNILKVKLSVFGAIADRVRKRVFH
jgi:peptidoglycan/xylan/chitin deacetylase (PgdA/CDA1 family)